MNLTPALRAIVFAAIVLLLAPLPALAQSAPERCKTGVFVADLHDLSQTARNFDADLWFWSVCAGADRKPLQTMEYINANKVITSLDSTLPRNGGFWSNRKVVGEWRHDWNLSSYPFDRQTLQMVVEEGVDDDRAFAYDADTERSAYDPAIHIPGWRITGFRLVPVDHDYPTSFGDPTLAPGAGAQFSRLSIEVDIERDGVLSFLKLTSVVYVAAILALMSFRIDPSENFGDRFGLLAGALFATVVSMSVASDQLGSNDQLTLIDLIHISCLLLIVAASILTLLANYRVRLGRSIEALRQLDVRYMLTLGGLFVLFNMAMVARALIVR